MIWVTTQCLRCYPLTECSVTWLVVLVGHEASLDGRPGVTRATYVEQAVVRTLPIARLLNTLCPAAFLRLTLLRRFDPFTFVLTLSADL
jgi:hypothetical protein